MTAGRFLLRRLRRDRRGASLTELALVAPLLVLFLTGIVDLGRGLSERFTMQQAINRTLELLQAGPIETDADAEDVDYSYLVTEAANAAGVPRENVALTRWRECDNVRQDEYAGSCDLGAETARYVQLRIAKPYDAMFFLDGYTLAADAAVRVQ